jgi:carboxyl-terminal processing protease
MMKNTPPAKRRFAWSAVAAAMVLVSAISVSVPRAFAQGTDPQTQEMSRYYQLIEGAFQYVFKNYVDDVDAKKLYEGAMKGMLEALGDPYSLYLDEATLNYLNDRTIVGQFGGVGVSIAKQAISPKAAPDTPSYVEIFSVFDGTPGYKAGFRPGDLILKVEDESTAPLTIDEVQSKIRGEPGSKVRLTIRRGEAEFEVSLVRAVIEIPTVTSGLIPSQAGNIAYLRVMEFSPQTYSRVRDALKTFDASGYRAMIIDLRSNPGGLLQSAVQIADLFLDTGTIVSTKGRNPYENEIIKAKADLPISKDKPVVVLVNKGSASASEILAGALKDNRRALLVGENTYGKGSVQQVIPVGDTGIKLTMARYYTPSDENIDKTGIPVDLESKELVLDEAQSLELQKLADSEAIATWAKQNPKANVEERKAFAHKLAGSYPSLPESLLSRFVRDELIATEVSKPAYDLEFDTALVAAIKLIDAPDFQARLQSAKTVKELVEAKKAAAAAAPAAAAASGAKK